MSTLMINQEHIVGVCVLHDKSDDDYGSKTKKSIIFFLLILNSSKNDFNSIIL